MNDVIRPVRFGVLIGLCGLAFGIGWAVWLVLGHESIHSSLEARASTASSAATLATMDRTSNSVALKPTQNGQTAGLVHEHNEPVTHVHKDGISHRHVAELGPAMTKEAAVDINAGSHHEGHAKDLHDDPMLALAHKRLTRGHLHAMGLGLVTIVISLVIAFISAPRIVKTIAPVLTGLGGLIYPLAWIAMGYRTPSLGPELAEASVLTIAGPGIALVLIGLVTAAVFLTKDIFSRDVNSKN